MRHFKTKDCVQMVQEMAPEICHQNHDCLELNTLPNLKRCIWIDAPNSTETYHLHLGGVLCLSTQDKLACRRCYISALPWFFGGIMLSHGASLVYQSSRFDPFNAKTLPVGEVGEILTKGYAVMQGYWNDPVKTAEAIVDGWMHTGYLDSMDKDGYITVADRSKDMMVRGCENIYPIEVENF